MDISDAVRTARKAAGLTQEQLAALMDVSKGAVARWEGGGGGNGVKPDNLVKLARVLEVSAASLLGEGADISERVTNPRELAWLEAFRTLSPELRELHLNLVRRQIMEGKPSKHGRTTAQNSPIPSGPANDPG